MSNQQPGPTSRRRRIAGERRGPAAPGGTDEAERTVAPPAPPRRPTPTPATTPTPASTPASTPSAAAVPDPAPDAAAAAAAGPRRGRGLGGRGLVLGLAGLLTVLLIYVGLMLLGLLGTEGVADLDRAEAEASAGRAAQSSAERAAEAVLAYDFKTLEEDRDAATRFMTAEYARDYVGTFDTAVVDVATESKAQVTVEVQGSAVMTASVDRARVLLFVDQATLSNASPQPRLALNRVEFQMVKQGDSWVVDDILSF